jgi:hypothetical protein
LRKNEINLLKQKVDQKVAIHLGFFILSKNHYKPPKVAELVKNHPIWSPCSPGAVVGFEPLTHPA